MRGLVFEPWRHTCLEREMVLPHRWRNWPHHDWDPLSIHREWLWGDIWVAVSKEQHRVSPVWILLTTDVAELAAYFTRLNGLDANGTTTPSYFDQKLSPVMAKKKKNPSR